MTRCAWSTACAPNPDTTLILRITHPTPVTTPSSQLPTTTWTRRHWRRHLPASGHVLRYRCLPRPDDRHRVVIRLTNGPHGLTAPNGVLMQLRQYTAAHPHAETPLTARPSTNVIGLPVSCSART